MKKLSIALILCSIGAASTAQVYKIDKEIVCSSVKTVFEYVSETYNEIPVWQGASMDSKFMLTANAQTKTWTMIEYNNQFACVVGSGDKAHVINLDKRS